MKAVIAGVVAVAATGVCSQCTVDKVQQQIDKTLQFMRENCREIQDPARRDQCVADLNAQATTINGQFTAYLAACAAGDDDLARQILEGLRDFLKPRTGVTTTPSGAAANIVSPLDRCDSVVLTGVAAATGVVNADLVEVSGTLYHADATGSLLTEAAKLGATPPAQALPAQPAVSYTIGTGASADIATCDSSVDSIGLSGGFSLASADAAARAGGTRRAVTALKISLQPAALAGQIDMSLRATSKHNELVILPGGAGYLQAEVVLSGWGEAFDRTLIRDFLIRIPVVENAFGQIVFTTAAAVRGTDIVPTIPFPFADFNDDGIVDANDAVAFQQAWSDGSLEADMNWDNQLTQDDADRFMEMYLYETN